LVWRFSSIPTLLLDISRKDIHNRYGSMGGREEKGSGRSNRENPAGREHAGSKNYHDSLLKDVEGEQVNGWTRSPGSIA